jgi:hypothetical protein
MEQRPVRRAAALALLLLPWRLASGQTPPPTRERVTFALQTADGEPLAHRVRAHLYSLDGEVSAGGTWSDESGVVSYERLPCARYDLWVEGVDAGDEALSAPLFRALEVTAGDGPQTFALRLPKAGTVRGRLMCADGQTPAAKYMIAVRSGTVPDEGAPTDAWPAAYARGALDCYAQTEVAADGSFTLAGLTPGTHALDIRLPGEREAWCTVPQVEVKAGEATDLGTIRAAWNGWQYLFNRRTLDGWAESDFWGRKEVRIEGDRIVMPMGNDMTGITWTGDLPRVDYEVSLQAMRVAGDDFFCGLTFPVRDDYCSLILGGWGGSVVGLSSLDGADASENETTKWINFDLGRWYRVRVKVTGTRITAWLDAERVVDVSTENRHIGIRIEVEPSRPFGISTWRTTGAARDIRLRRLDAGEQ